jgi:hypothetical protein
MEIKTTCPLGHQCEKAVDGAIERCAWFTQIRGKNPQSEEVVDEWACAIQWLPLLSVEVSQTNRGQTAAIESFRNETVKRQDAFLGLAHQASQARLKGNGD